MSVKFCLTETDNKIKVDVEGSGEDLINMLASAIESSSEIREILSMSFLAVMMKEEELNIGGSEEDDEELAKVLSKMKIGKA